MRLVTLLGTAVFSWPRAPQTHFSLVPCHLGLMERDLRGTEERGLCMPGWCHCPFLLIFLLALSWQLLLPSPSHRAPQMGRRKDKLFLHLVPGLCGGLGWQRDANSFIFKSWRVFLKVTLQPQML